MGLDVEKNAVFGGFWGGGGLWNGCGGEKGGGVWGEAALVEELGEVAVASGGGEEGGAVWAEEGGAVAGDVDLPGGVFLGVAPEEDFTVEFGDGGVEGELVLFPRALDLGDFGDEFGGGLESLRVEGVLPLLLLKPCG